MQRIVIHTVVSRERIIEFVRQLPSAMTGRGPDPGGVGEGVRARLAWQWFSLVWENFRDLSRGGQGADNQPWPPNTPAYLAYKKGPKSERMGSGWAPNNWAWYTAQHVSQTQQLGRPPKGTGNLSKVQLERWWARYMEIKGYLLTAGWPDRAAKAVAASTAWEETKARGGKTLLQTHGNRPDQILVDRGVLRLTLQPGYTASGYGPRARYRPAHAQQVYEEEVGLITCGTAHPHAAKHHYGQGPLPERRLWPGRMPDQWKSRMYRGVVSAMVQIRELFP